MTKRSIPSTSTRSVHASTPARQHGDRPPVVPDGAVNFAFIGQFSESQSRDCIFTTEYSVRTPMEAVYTLLDLERGVPEVYGSTYDARELLNATSRLRDGEEVHLPRPHLLGEKLYSKFQENKVGKLISDYKLIEKP